MYIDYVELWADDYESIIETAVRNMQDDLKCGYDPNGCSILHSRAVIAELEAKYENGLDHISTMTEKQAQKWCKLDMKRRGAIS